jgi:hypothetical protein
LELAPDEKHQNWHSEDLKGQDLKGNTLDSQAALLIFINGGY